MITTNINTGVNSLPASFEELSHAARCLELYLYNTAEIYERYTTPAINAVALVNCKGFTPEAIENVRGAIRAAASLVHLNDDLAPSLTDIEAVTAEYVAYIVETAKDNIKYSLNA